MVPLQTMRRARPLIVGGGPAGAAAAIVLARAGQEPIVLERSAAPGDALCGGFLSWSTVSRLRILGVDPQSLGAHRVERVRLLAGELSAEARLPRRCWSLSRRALDAALLDEAAAAGALVRRGVKVVNIAESGIELVDGTTLCGGPMILATGKHELRGAGRAGPVHDPALGLRWRLAGTERLRAMLADAVELHLFGGGYAGISIQEDGSANLCLAVRRSILVAAGGDPLNLLARLCAQHPHLARRIDAAGADPGLAQAVANVPYGWIAPHPMHGAMRIGDQAAVIPSLAGEGMAIALASGMAAGAAVLARDDAALFQRRLARRARFPVMVAGAIARSAANPVGGKAIVGLVRLIPQLSRMAARLSRMGDP
jgi:menaquinone-9 beta-reductase